MNEIEYKNVLCYHLDSVCNPTWIQVQSKDNKIWATDDIDKIKSFLTGYQSWLASGNMILKLLPREACKNETNTSTKTCTHSSLQS